MKTPPHHAGQREARAGGPQRPLRLASTLLCLLSSVLCPLPLSAQSVSVASAAEIKRITDRYELTRTRISALLDLRLKPVPLPANPPNPFYQTPAAALGPETKLVPDPAILVPESADITDIDTLRKYATTLRIGGVITMNEVLHLAINNTTSKVGDIITVGSKDRPIYLKLLELSLTEFTIGLNDAKLAVPIRK